MRRLSAWVDERTAPVAITMLLAVGALVYSLWWAAAATHQWHSFSDLWNSAGLALAIGHGHFGAVYAPPSQLDSPPGLEYVLAPVMVVGHDLFGLATTHAQGSTEPFSLILPSVATVLATTVLFALDAVARLWDYGEAKRLGLAAVAGLGVVSATAFWGHPEDCMALAFAIWAALAVARDGAHALRRAAWLLGVAVALQPLALLALAPVLARFGWRDLRAAAWRVALPSVAVLVPELVASGRRTLHAIVDQPYNPLGESTTPLAHFARSLGGGMYSGGTLRLVATAAAVVLGYALCRHRHDLSFVLFVMVLAFTVRVLLESELLGFYFFPVVALCLLLTLRRSWALFWVGTGLSVVSLVLGNHKVHHLVPWWPAMMLVTLALVGLAWATVTPTPSSAGRRRPTVAPDTERPMATTSHVRVITDPARMERAERTARAERLGRSPATPALR